jgi:signal transduction histidine kinase
MTTLQQRALNTERLRISRDIHDNVGSRLTEIILLSELARRNQTKASELEMHVGRLSNVAREVVRDLDEIVWAVNPKNDFLDNLADYIFEYVENFLGMTSIRFRVDLAEDVPHQPLSSAARHNLFLVVKEALNNVVKHSAATEVWVRAKTENGDLTFEIEDNGKGFEKQADGLGNGLGNMDKRMKEVDGRFELESCPGNGTRIKISVPLCRNVRRSTRLRVEVV